MGTLLLAEKALFGANERGIVLFGFEIYYYAICIVSGILLSTLLSALLMKRRNMSPDFIFTLFVFCIPSALICARLFYCVTRPLPIGAWFSWSSIREGGLSVIGGVIGGVAAGLIVCLVKKVEFFRAADCVVVTILLAQALGRWGNFFNKEVYGQEVKNAALQWFPFAVPVSPSSRVFGVGSFSDPTSTWHYAFFFYEMLLNLLGFGLLFTGAWYLKKKPNGLLTFGYFVWYGLVRAVMEPLRDPDYILDGGGVPWSLVTSVLMIAFGLAGVGALLYLNYKKEGAPFGSKKGDPCGITDYLTPYKDDPPYFSKINMFGDKYPPKPPKQGKGGAEERGTDKENLPKSDPESGTQEKSGAREKNGVQGEDNAQEKNDAQGEDNAQKKNGAQENNEEQGKSRTEDSGGGKAEREERP